MCVQVYTVYRVTFEVSDFAPLHAGWYIVSVSRMVGP